MPGTNNVTVTMNATLFEDFSNGDLRLTTAGQTAFTDVALWQAGDPSTDIDGALRPTTAGSSDICGAHEGP